jgi:hypothetical protein
MHRRGSPGVIHALERAAIALSRARAARSRRLGDMRLKSLDHIHPRPSRPSRPWPPNPRIQATMAAGTPSGLRLSCCACGPRRLVASLPPAESRAMSCGEDRMTKLSHVIWRAAGSCATKRKAGGLQTGREMQRCRDADAVWQSSWCRWVWCLCTTGPWLPRGLLAWLRSASSVPANDGRRCANAVACSLLIVG